MERSRGGGVEQQNQAASKFTVYQNSAIAAALRKRSLRPSKFTFLFILSLVSASSLALLISASGENEGFSSFRSQHVSEEVSSLLVKGIRITAAIVLVGSLLAFVKAVLLWRLKDNEQVTVISPSKGTKEQMHLTNRQLNLIGLKSKVEPSVLESSKKPPKSATKPTSPTEALVPLHHHLTNPNCSSSKSSPSSKLHYFSSPSKSSPSSGSLYLVPASSSQSPSVQNSVGSDKFGNSPWSNKRATLHKEITSEEELERFLADVDEKISESASKLVTPPPTIKGFGVTTPNTIATSTNTSGTKRSTPLRPVRMSPGSQKFTTPPKKGDADLPPPMSMEESIEAFQDLGIYPEIELWRDRLRQWFSSVLLNPLLIKIDTSHEKVMQAAAKLGITITISQVGSENQDSGTTAAASPIGRTNEWQPAFAVDEDGLLHQLRTILIQSLDACLTKLSPSNPQQSPQASLLVRNLQECIDAIAEHQRLNALVKGEWGKGLLPHSSIRPEYTVQRIRELAEGTCVKNYEYLGSGEVYEKANKKWSLELPTDSHLLLYLFCAFLEHPKWMLHVDPTAYAGAQSSKNPLFLGVLPPKERFPEKYLAIVSGVPSVLHPGACVLAFGKQSPPVFALYWEKKHQFSLQGRTALWDSILLLCYKIRTGYGGIVRGMHLGSSALNILPVLDSDTED